ncbi:MAG: hypothetical protein OXG56_07615 [Gammaproteobacteria bacterium]|nr:hypothetical protein [Gammaproteobacteria bacterium]
MPKIKNKNILVCGVDNPFSRKLVEDLAVEGNSLFLYGGNDALQNRLHDIFPGHIKGTLKASGQGQYMQLQALIEVFGSLDAIIYLVSDTLSEYCATRFVAHQRVPGEEASFEPVSFVHAVYPYLRKFSNSKIVFVDLGMTAVLYSRSSIHWGWRAICSRMQEEFKGKQVEVSAIATPELVHFHDQSPMADSVAGRQYRNITASISRAIRSVEENAADPSALDRPLVV